MALRAVLLKVFLKFSSFVFNNKSLKRLYLNMATFLSNHGIKPPLAPSSRSINKRWSQQGTSDSTIDPIIYTQEDRSLEELFKEITPYLSKTSTILELGCNAGRSLNYLHSNGYRNLTGIEIGSEAVEIMKNSFPQMYQDSNIIVGDAPSQIKKLSKDQFDLVFCHSVLVSIPPKDNSIFKDMARVSSKFILILENEGSFKSYPRDFKKMFESQGYKMIVSKVFTGMCLSFPMPFKEEDLYSNNTIRLFVEDKSR